MIGHIEYDTLFWLYGFTPSVFKANEMPRQSDEKVPSLSPRWRIMYILQFSPWACTILAKLYVPNSRTSLGPIGKVVLEGIPGLIYREALQVGQKSRSVCAPLKTTQSLGQQWMVVRERAQQASSGHYRMLEVLPNVCQYSGTPLN